MENQQMSIDNLICATSTVFRWGSTGLALLALHTVMPCQGALIIDSGEYLADLNDLTVGGNPETAEQFFTSDKVVGGSRETPSP